MVKSLLWVAALVICVSGIAAAELPQTQSFSLSQRSSAQLPGLTAIDVSIGDITAGQTLTHVSWRQGRYLAGPKSLHARDSLGFTVGGEQWSLTLAYLHNELIGNDWARFELNRLGPALQKTQHTSNSAVALSEIRALISAVESTRGAVFIRNGEEYDAQSAADHLRRKLKAAGSRIRSAEDFIDRIASKSSLSGNPYAMRLASGTTVDAGEWFRAQLAQIRAASTSRM